MPHIEGTGTLSYTFAGVGFAIYGFSSLAINITIRIIKCNVTIDIKFTIQSQMGYAEIPIYTSPELSYDTYIINIISPSVINLTKLPICVNPNSNYIHVNSTKRNEYWEKKKIDEYFSYLVSTNSDSLAETYLKSPIQNFGFTEISIAMKLIS